MHPEHSRIRRRPVTQLSSTERMSGLIQRSVASLLCGTLMTRPRLLLIDDSTDAREAFCELLDLLDFDVTGVGFGREALRLLDHESFDAVVLDPRLPDIDGIAVLRMARSRPEGPVSIVFCGSVVLKGAAEAAGCDAFILKPEVEEVVAALTVLLVERCLSMEEGPTDEVFDAVAAELKAQPVAEREPARVVRRFGGS